MSARLHAGAPALAAALLLVAPVRAQAPTSPVAPEAPPAALPPVPPEAQPGAVIVVVPPTPASPPWAQPQPYPPAQPPWGQPWPYAYPPATQAMPPQAEPPERPDRGFSFKLQGGPTYQRLFDSEITGFEGGLWFGAVRGISGIYGGFDVTLAHLDRSLFTVAVRPGATWEARLGIVRLGVGGGFSFLAVERATNRDFMGTFGAGFTAFASVDLVKGERNALFLGARIRAEVIAGRGGDGDTPVVWGPSALLGWRYR